jgi:hypothetical protein
MSYAGRVVFGFTANGSALPEVESMARYAAEALEALQRASGRRAGTRAKRIRSAASPQRAPTRGSST